MTSFQFHSRETLAQIDWPANKRFEHDYLLPLLAEGASPFIDNVKTNLAMLTVGGNLFPVSINDFEYDSCYVCSPYTGYVGYALEELKKLKNPILEKSLSVVIAPLGKMLRWGKINKILCINNWLLSTNLYPAWEGKEIPEITDYLIKRFPEHAIMCRSLNHATNAALLNSLENAGYICIPSRQVYIFDKAKSIYLGPNTKAGFSLLRKTHYQVVGHDDITPADYPRIKTLYDALYLEKYSYHNPQFTEACIKLWHEKKLLDMLGLRHPDGHLDGIVGNFDFNGVTTAPLVGYDTSLPQNVGLYRMLMTLTLKRAYENDLLWHMSAGASSFKKYRGGIPHIEYSAVYIKHLPFRQRLPWNVLRAFLVNVGIPIMRKYEL